MQLAQELTERGVEVSRTTAAALLDRAGFRRRALCKELITGAVDPRARDRQFRHIAALRRSAARRGIPVLSIDIKKNYSSAPQVVFDHDFAHLAEGRLVPHGVYAAARQRQSRHRRRRVSAQSDVRPRAGARDK